MQHEPDTGSQPLTPITITLDCTHTQHDREQFQREGHFVPSNCTGPTVHALTLLSPAGQLLRVLAPTHGEAIRLMEQALKAHVITSGVASLQRDFTYESYQSLVQDAATLALFIADNYQYEDLHGQLNDSTPLRTALYYLRVERLRWRIRLRDWLAGIHKRPTLRSDSNDWIPKDQGGPHGGPA